MNNISNGVIQVLDQLKANGQLNDYLIDDDERKWTKLVYDIMVNKFGMPFGKGTMKYANEIFNSDVRVWKGKNKLGNMMNMESKNVNKKLIRLTESDLHRIVKESVNRVLKEGHNEDYMEAKQIIDGMDFEDVKKLPYMDNRFSFGALNGSEGEGLIDLNFKGILVTVRSVAKVTNNFEKYDEGGKFLGVEG